MTVNLTGDRDLGNIVRFLCILGGLNSIKLMRIEYER